MGEEGVEAPQTPVFNYLLGMSEENTAKRES